MRNDRREFMRIASTVAAGAAVATTSATAQEPAQFKNIKALAFDFYGTVLDVFSATAPACEQLFPGKGNQLAQIWRTKQLIYILMRNSMGRHREFFRVTEDALVCAANTLQLQLTEKKRKELVELFFLGQPTYPDVKSGLEALKSQGAKLIVLANGEQKTMEEGAKRVGVFEFFDRFISVEEVKVYKVNPRVYNYGADQLNITNAELGFVAAHSWDIMGAASAGLPTFWIQRSPTEVQEELGFRATTTVKGMPDIAPLLRL
jgi:2-haloacid dehalogenase